MYQSLIDKKGLNQMFSLFVNQKYQQVLSLLLQLIRLIVD